MNLQEAIRIKNEYSSLIGKRIDEGAVVTNLLVVPANHIQEFEKHYIFYRDADAALSAFPDNEYGVIVVDETRLSQGAFVYRILADTTENGETVIYKLSK